MGKENSGVKLRLETVRASSGAVLWRASAYDGEKLIEQANMTADDAVTLIQGAKRRKEVPQVVKIEEIPSGLISSIKSTDGNVIGGIFYIPPAKHQFVLAKTTERERQAYYMPLPGLVYGLVSVGGDVSFKKCFAVKEWEGMRTALCQYPFGNVSNVGEICMGTANRKGVTTYDALKEYIEDGLSAVTNSDYLAGDDVRATTKITQHELCDRLAEAEQFPVELLLNHETIPTVEALKAELYKFVGV